MGDGDSGHTGNPLGTWATLGMAVLLAFGLISTRCELGPDTTRAYASRLLPPEPEPVILAPPEVESDYRPCKSCHKQSKYQGDPKKRELEKEHDEHVLTHGDLWCMDCHDTARQANLHLANGKLLRFKHSRRLCLQCHGEKLADWTAGVHGKRRGSWWGAKEVWDCVACHNPHAPRFTEVVPEPPPRRPEDIARQNPLEEESSSESR